MRNDSECRPFEQVATSRATRPQPCICQAPSMGRACTYVGSRSSGLAGSRQEISQSPAKRRTVDGPIEAGRTLTADTGTRRRTWGRVPLLVTNSTTFRNLPVIRWRRSTERVAHKSRFKSPEQHQQNAAALHGYTPRT
ncbi:hypothetical protein Dda_1030 [Drechslerella dactyloides]|uniref:Uncharacterized protein n=1 Tax=Drechslerella dactyloides TaxID=74499 RepID=A0AAD6NNK7_DREDA|nr:hypothetical protein Dda_1030 [Drechslerella dactyloides]